MTRYIFKYALIGLQLGVFSILAFATLDWTSKSEKMFALLAIATSILSFGRIPTTAQFHKK